eukprot:Nitzschia sp. Nitz4//scaffold200_size39268//24505//25413//NITZ4_007620-RA/size39268-processed-gene-0.8-mRNA-1//1//CDS//3329541298//4064//frame0
MGALLQIALAEAAGGATAGIIADSVLYAIDSAKVRAQSDQLRQHRGSTPPAGRLRNVSILFRGLVPTILLGSVPVFGSFFFIYAPIRQQLQENALEQVIPLASAVCAIPATIVGVPSDVLKKRLVLGIDPNVRVAIANLTATQGWRGLFAGWHVNLVRDLPFAGVKIGFYEWFAYHWTNHFRSDQDADARISTLGAAACGVASGVACAIITCPLDVINTHIKAGETQQSTSIWQVGLQVCRKDGALALFRGVWMRSLVLGLGSSIFWPIQRHVAHTLQPYEKCPFWDKEEEGNQAEWVWFRR